MIESSFNFLNTLLVTNGFLSNIRIYGTYNENSCFGEVLPMELYYVVHLHAYCTWTIPEQSPWFKHIVIDFRSELIKPSLIYSPSHSLIQERHMATVMHAEHGNFYVISTFGTNNQLQNAKITQKIPSSATVLWEVCVDLGMRMYTNKYGNCFMTIESGWVGMPYFDPSHDVYVFLYRLLLSCKWNNNLTPVGTIHLIRWAVRIQS